MEDGLESYCAEFKVRELNLAVANGCLLHRQGPMIRVVHQCPCGTSPICAKSKLRLYRSTLTNPGAQATAPAQSFATLLTITANIHTASSHQHTRHNLPLMIGRQTEETAIAEDQEGFSVRDFSRMRVFNILVAHRNITESVTS